MTQFIIILLSMCQPPRIRLASASHPPRYCTARVKFVHSLIVRMMPPWLVERPRAMSVRLIPGCFNLVYYE